MEDRLSRYIDDIFEGAAPTKKALELKEEMLLNLHDKYNDLLAEGKTPDAAFNIAVVGIGDVSILLRQLEDGYSNEAELLALERAKQKSALLTAAAVMMYILCILPLILLSGSVGFPVMLVMIAMATGLLIFNNMTKPKYLKESDTVVEEFREWQSGTHEQRQMRRAISSALWSLVVVLYFIVSFGTGAWHISWIIFVIGGCVESLISVFLTARKK